MRGPFLYIGCSFSLSNLVLFLSISSGIFDGAFWAFLAHFMFRLWECPIDILSTYMGLPFYPTFVYRIPTSIFHPCNSWWLIIIFSSSLVYELSFQLMSHLHYPFWHGIRAMRSTSCSHILKCEGTWFGCTLRIEREWLGYANLLLLFLVQ